MDQPDTAHSPSKKRARGRRATDTTAPNRSGRFAAGLALVLAVIAVLASGYMGYLINSKRGLSDAKGRLVQVEEETARLQELSAQMAKELDTQRESQAAIQDGLRSLLAELGKGRRAWLIAETENLLVIAQQRLALARDARLALEALRAADRQLEQLADPAYQPVRKQIAAEAAALEVYARQDLSSLAQRLGLLAGRLDGLPLAPEAHVPATAAGDSDFLREVWRDLQGLVRTRSTPEARRPLLLPEQKYFLRENLRLMLYGAQVALLHGDSATFDLNLRAARQWLRDHYDPQAGAVQDAQRELEAIVKARPPALPELGAALRALREITGPPGAA
jgi:uroporphyrin-III C-methyltransferase